MKPYDRVKASREREKTLRGVMTRAYATTRKNSKEKGLPIPTYTREEFDQWLEANDIAGLYDIWVKSNYNKWVKPSVDRLDDSKGYEFTNIRLVTWEVNFLKSRVVYATKERALRGLVKAREANCKAVRINGKEVKSIKEAADLIGCYPSSINKAISEKRLCKGNEVSYV